MQRADLNARCHDVSTTEESNDCYVEFVAVYFAIGLAPLFATTGVVDYGVHAELIANPYN